MEQPAYPYPANMIAVDPNPASILIETKRVNLIKAADAEPARAAEIEAKLPPTPCTEYRAGWLPSLAGAKSRLVWIWSCTACRGHKEDGKRSYWIDEQPRSIIDEVFATFVDVDRICREVRNSANVLARLEVDAAMLNEAAFARRESIKLRNELYQEDVVEVLSEIHGSDSFEVWRIYDATVIDQSQTEIGRIFLDCANKRKVASAKRNPCRHMEVIRTAPLGYQPVPQVLWSLTLRSRSALLTLDGVITLAKELGEILDTIFRLSVDPVATVQPRSASNAEKFDHAPLRITAQVLKLLARQPRSLQKMLHADAVQHDFIQRLIKTKHLGQVHEIRCYLARLHAWVGDISGA